MTNAPSARDDVTQWLVDLRRGKDEVYDSLFEHVYAELRQRARGQRRRWKGDPSLQTTALVNEAYLKLVAQDEQSWASRSHFFAVAAKAMRHILINEARRKCAQKRGGETPPLSLEALREMLGREVALAEQRAEVLLVLDEALEQFRGIHPRAARGIECRFFGGMTIAETAEALGVSTATISRDWKLAQAWLYREMKQILEDAPPTESDEA